MLSSEPVYLVNEDSIFSTKRVFALSAPENNMCQISGRMFYCSAKSDSTPKEESHSFLQDQLHSLLYFSCRKEMRALEYLGTSVESDEEWGCTIRVAQMALASVLKRHMFEKRVSSFNLNNNTESEFKQLIQLFAESQSLEDMNQSPFGFHSLLTQCINLFDNPIKNGYSGYQVMKSIKHQFKQQKILTTLKLSMSSNPTIFQEDLKRKMKTWNKSLLLIIHLNKSSSKKVSETGEEQLKQLMDLEYFVGAATQMKKQALFTLGYMNNQLLSLDPSQTQIASKSPLQMTQQDLKTYFAKKIRADSFSKFENEMTLMFYIRTERQFNLFLSKISSLQSFYESSEEQFPISIENSQFDISLRKHSSSMEVVIDLQ